MAKTRLHVGFYALLIGLVVCPMRLAFGEVVLKMMVVNPSETEVKEYDIRSPLPQEVKPEHVLDTDGLKVDYDSQAGAFVLVGHLTLKPKESVTKQVILQDVWVIPADRFSSLRREIDDIMRKLRGSSYYDRGDMLARAIDRKLAQAQESQDQAASAPPMQHINAYRDNLKILDAAEIDMVSLRQLMVMAAINTTKPGSEALPSIGDGGHEKAGEQETGGLSVLATWRLIFVVLGLLGFVSLSFFMIWQRQLKLQLAKQAQDEQAASGKQATADDALQLPPTSPGPAP